MQGLKVLNLMEQHVNGEVVQATVYEAETDVYVYEINGESIFPVALKKGDYLYLMNKHCTEWEVTTAPNGLGHNSFGTVFDARTEYLVAYQGTNGDGEFVTSEIMKKGKFNNLKSQIKSWLDILNAKYPDYTITNILSFSKY